MIDAVPCKLKQPFPDDSPMVRTLAFSSHMDSPFWLIRPWKCIVCSSRHCTLMLCTKSSARACLVARHTAGAELRLTAGRVLLYVVLPWQFVDFPFSPLFHRAYQPCFFIFCTSCTVPLKFSLKRLIHLSCFSLFRFRPGRS